MPFRPRNPYYLRISDTIVLPLYVYLDDRHLDWMSDRVLQHVISDLRPNILFKLKTEADGRQSAATSAKKLTVDTHRGDFYQFCYFLRKTEPHSVLIKNRVFTTAPIVKSSKKRKIPQGEPSAPKSAQPRKKHKGKGKGKQVVEEEDDDDIEILDDSPDVIDLAAEEDEEQKPKPIMNLRYQGFNIYNHCLCVVVEPWPPVRGQSVAPSVTPTAGTRAPSIAPADYVPQGSKPWPKSTLPLFLPDDDDDDLPIVVGSRILPPVPRFNDPPPRHDSDNEDDAFGGMLELSQVLSSAGDMRAGAMEDEEEEDNAIFFGDADEVRELA